MTKKSFESIVSLLVGEVNEDLVMPNRELQNFKSQYKQKWIKAHRDRRTFFKKNQAWLTGKVRLKRNLNETQPIKPNLCTKCGNSIEDENFNLEQSNRTKRRKKTHIRNVCTTD